MKAPKPFPEPPSDTRERLLEATIELLAGGGFEAVSIRSVLR